MAKKDKQIQRSFLTVSIRCLTLFILVLPDILPLSFKETPTMAPSATAKISLAFSAVNPLPTIVGRLLPLLIS